MAKQYSIEEIAQMLRPYADFKNHGINGSPTMVDQYRNADIMLDELDRIEDIHDPGNEKYYNNFANQFKGEKFNAVANGVLTGATAAGTILSNAVRDSQIQDTSMYENEIANLGNEGNYNYGSFNQLENDIANRQELTPVSYDEIRGMNTGQKIGSVASSAATGAMAGLTIGGPWGALVGGVVGLGGGLAGVLTGDKKAEAKQAYLASSASHANGIANINTQAAHERIAGNDNRYKMVRAVANGGQIQRKKESIQDFASRVLGEPSRTQIRTSPQHITRTKVDGGIRIRIKK